MENSSGEWCRDYANLLALARWLASDFRDIESVIRFFEMPWKFEEEFLAMQAGYPNLAAYRDAKVHKAWTAQEILDREG